MRHSEKNRIVILAVILGALVLITIAAYLQPYKAGKEYRELKDYSETMGTQTIAFTINDYDLLVDTYADKAIYEAGWLTTEQETVLTVGEFSGCAVTVNGIPVESGGSVSFWLDTLSKDTLIPIQIVDERTDWVHGFSIRTLPLNIPQFDFPVSSDEEGAFCFSIENYLIKMNHRGEILYYRVSMGASDFQQVNQNGKVRYTFCEAVDELIVSDPAQGAYKGVVMDEKYQVIDIIETTLLSKDEAKGYRLCEYGFEYIDDGHYIVATAYPSCVSNIPDTVKHNNLGVRVVANRVQEIKNGEIIWSWDTIDNQELYEYGDLDKDYYNNRSLYADYAYLNDIAINGKDQTVVCSFQNLNAIVFLDRKTGEVKDVIKGEGNFFAPKHISLSEKGDILIFASDASDHASAYRYVGGENLLREIDIGIQGGSIVGGSVSEDRSGELLLISWGYRNSPGMLFTEVDLKKGSTSFEIVLKNPTAGGHVRRVSPAEERTVN